jgi:hypothetical protein
MGVSQRAPPLIEDRSFRLNYRLEMLQAPDNKPGSVELLVARRDARRFRQGIYWPFDWTRQILRYVRIGVSKSGRGGSKFVMSAPPPPKAGFALALTSHVLGLLSGAFVGPAASGRIRWLATDTKCTDIQQGGAIASRRYTNIHLTRVPEQHYAALIRARAF